MGLRSRARSDQQIRGPVRRPVRGPVHGLTRWPPGSG